MAVEPQAPAKKTQSLRTLLLLVLVVLLTVFAVMNWGPVPVWPLGTRPLSAVIAISFVLGALIGWLGRSLVSHRPSRPE